MKRRGPGARLAAGIGGQGMYMNMSKYEPLTKFLNQQVG
jgi:hypothetical protein